MKKIFIACLLAIFVISCDKENNRDEVKGMLENLALDGCGIMIKLDDGTRLEPVANSSGKTLEAGRRIAITYKSKPAVSICMAGETVEIISLRYL